VKVRRSPSGLLTISKKGQVDESTGSSRQLGCHAAAGAMKKAPACDSVVRETLPAKFRKEVTSCPPAPTWMVEEWRRGPGRRPFRLGRFFSGAKPTRQRGPPFSRGRFLSCPTWSNSSKTSKPKGSRRHQRKAGRTTVTATGESAQGPCANSTGRKRNRLGRTSKEYAIPRPAFTSNVQEGEHWYARFLGGG